MSEPATPVKNLRMRQITILVPGTFAFLHYGHFRFFRDCKAAFSKVKLVVGIHDSPQCFLTDEEKVKTLSHLDAVDEVILHLPTVDRQLMDEHHIDYVAVWTEFEPQILQVRDILCLPGYPQISTEKIAAKISVEEDDFLMHILEDELQARECGMSRAQLGLIELKRNLRRKLLNWFPSFFPEESRDANSRANGLIKRAMRFLGRLIHKPRNLP